VNDGTSIFSIVILATVFTATGILKQAKVNLPDVRLFQALALEISNENIFLLE
jgi:hypothetical protein